MIETRTIYIIAPTGTRAAELGRWPNIDRYDVARDAALDLAGMSVYEITVTVTPLEVR